MVDAWSNQAASLVEVQKYGSSLEKDIRNLLDWDSGRLVYDNSRKYKIQVDCCFPTLDAPEIIGSVTYANPDKPGHSNENKLQLKLGELALAKAEYPNIRVMLILGGTQEAWLPYVLKAFEFFFDDVIFLWRDGDYDKLVEYSKDPQKVPFLHADFWAKLRTDWKTRKLSPEARTPPKGLLRYKVLDQLKAIPICKAPEDIPYDIARACMIAARNANGKEWSNYEQEKWEAIEMSRSYFNPVEAATQLTLEMGKFKYEGGLAKDVEVRSFLHDLGMSKTKLSEDFILHSQKFNLPVYIQCKASGGGRAQHGKNIQNRTKEQVARSIMYRSVSADKKSIEFLPKKYIWIGVVDGDWGVTKSEPLKYIHMLELAGYDHILCAEDLVDDNLNLNITQNPLQILLTELKC